MATESMRNTARPWMANDIRVLKRLAKANKPMSGISVILGRTEAAIRAKAAELGISLEPIPETKQDP